MNTDDKRVLNLVQGSLRAEQVAKTIIYISRNPVNAGAEVKVGDIAIKVQWDAFIVFVDLEPGANWGHHCYYFAIRQEAEGLVKVEANMPPFLKAGTLSFRLLWRGPQAPGWAVVTDSE